MNDQNEKKRRGRPKGAKGKKIQILKTLAWAHSTLFSRERMHMSTSTYALARDVGADVAQWNRWLSGQQSATARTIAILTKNAKSGVAPADVYHVGPWVKRRMRSEADCEDAIKNKVFGACVPLWKAAEGDLVDICAAWAKIPKEVFLSWGPSMNDDPEHPALSSYFPYAEKWRIGGTVVRNAMVSLMSYVPHPFIELAASLTVARIDDHLSHPVLMYAPPLPEGLDPDVLGSVSPPAPPLSHRVDLEEALGNFGITIPMLHQACSELGLKLIDCFSLPWREYYFLLTRRAISPDPLFRALVAELSVSDCKPDDLVGSNGTLMGQYRVKY